MIFKFSRRLLENITEDQIVEFDKLRDKKSQLDFINNNVLNSPPYDKMEEIHKVITQSILTHKLDVRRNPFLNLVSTLKTPLKGDDLEKKFKYLLDSYITNKMSLKQDYLQNESLYDRTFEDFKYTVNTFNTIISGKVKKYLKKLKDFGKGIPDVGIEALIDESGAIKTAKQIWSIVEAWSKNNEKSSEDRAKEEEEEKDGTEKEDPSSKESKKMYTLEDAYPRKLWSYDFFKAKINEVFKNASRFELKSRDKNVYLKKLFILFKYKPLVSEKNLKSLKDTTNVVEGKRGSEITSKDASKFGDPHKNPDIPIKIKPSESPAGVFLFNEFIPILEGSGRTYRDILAKQNAAQKSISYVECVPSSTGEQMRDEDKLQGLINALDRVSV